LEQEGLIDMASLTPKKLPSTDVVVVGLGWAGSIIANELADTGLSVIGFERGPWRDTASDFNVAAAADELRYSRQELMLRTRQTPAPCATSSLKRHCRCAIGAPSTPAMVLVAPATTGPALPSVSSLKSSDYTFT
jgi:choline dehydrogenase-like flavoprotein